MALSLRMLLTPKTHVSKAWGRKLNAPRQQDPRAVKHPCAERPQTRETSKTTCQPIESSPDNVWGVLYRETTTCPRGKQTAGRGV
eukprot:2446252-Pyramimonas_sp.AAC.1